MVTAYMLNVTLHVLAALLWLGGMFFLAAVGAPVLRKVEPPSLRQALFRDVGAQFRAVGWACIVVLLVTGTLNLWFRGLLDWYVLGSAEFWGQRYGRTLATKLLLVVLMIGIQAVHDFRHGPRASLLEPGSEAALRMRRTASWLARVNAVLGVALVYVAVRLARGG